MTKEESFMAYSKAICTRRVGGICRYVYPREKIYCVSGMFCEHKQYVQDKDVPETRICNHKRERDLQGCFWSSHQFCTNSAGLCPHSPLGSLFSIEADHAWGKGAVSASYAICARHDCSPCFFRQGYECTFDKNVEPNCYSRVILEKGGVPMNILVNGQSVPVEEGMELRTSPDGDVYVLRPTLLVSGKDPAEKPAKPAKPAAKSGFGSQFRQVG